MLRDWAICAHPEGIEARNIIDIAWRLERCRSLLGSYPLHITSWWRPPPYNRGRGARNSAHLEGRAVDFLPPQGMSADQAREVLLPNLETLGLRMEQLAGSSWIHIDTRPPGAGGRYFAP